jgi:hypothetical protein
MFAHIRHSKDLLLWNNAAKPQVFDWPEPSSSFRGYEQMNLGGLETTLPSASAIDQNAFAWINEAKFRKGILENRIADIEKKMETLVRLAENLKPKEIAIRDLTRNQAKKEIIRYFKTHHGENIDASDIEDDLGIDIMLAIEICEELEKEGQIRGV